MQPALGLSLSSNIRRRSARALVGTVVTFFAISLGVVNAATSNVTNCNDTGPGSLREAINAADVAGGRNTIKFAVDCPSSSPILLSSALDVTGSPAQSLTIVGRGPDKTIIDGQKATLVLGIDSGATVVVSGLTITHGVSQGGGGIANSGTLTIKGSTLSQNENDSYNPGGGVFNHGTLTVISSALSDNLASDGAGIENQGTLTVSGSTLSGNLSYDGVGGGIDNGGSLTIKGSTLSGNSSYFGDGGGIGNFGTLTIKGSTLSGNSSDTGDGGGMFNAGTATAGVSSSTITGNIAFREGGGIFNTNATPGSVTLTHTPVTGNSPDDCHPAIGSCTD